MDWLVRLSAVVAFAGFSMVVASLLFRGIQRMVGISTEELRDPGWRRTDTSGMAHAVFLLWPGIVVFTTGMLGLGVAALLRALVS